MESQPHVSPSGTVITWDGRLDNRSNLVRELGLPLSSNSTDLSIVTAAYEHWGMDSLAKLTGDWAISIWNSRSRSLIFAKDFVGTRHLYYTIDNNQVMWSTFSIRSFYSRGSLSRSAKNTSLVGSHSCPLLI